MRERRGILICSKQGCFHLGERMRTVSSMSHRSPIEAGEGFQEVKMPFVRPMSGLSEKDESVDTEPKASKSGPKERRLNKMHREAREELGNDVLSR